MQALIHESVLDLRNDRVIVVLVEHGTVDGGLLLEVFGLLLEVFGLLLEVLGLLLGVGNLGEEVVSTGDFGNMRGLLGDGGLESRDLVLESLEFCISTADQW